MSCTISLACIEGAWRRIRCRVVFDGLVKTTQLTPCIPEVGVGMGNEKLAQGEGIFCSTKGGEWNGANPSDLKIGMCKGARIGEKIPSVTVGSRIPF